MVIIRYLDDPIHRTWLPQRLPTLTLAVFVVSFVRFPLRDRVMRATVAIVCACMCARFLSAKHNDNTAAVVLSLCLAQGQVRARTRVAMETYTLTHGARSPACVYVNELFGRELEV